MSFNETTLYVRDLDELDYREIAIQITLLVLAKTSLFKIKLAYNEYACIIQ